MSLKNGARAKLLAIELGKTYVTSDGKKIRIICIDRVGYDPVLGLMLEGTGGEVAKIFKLDGTSEYGADLVSEYKEPVYNWTNVYKSVRGEGVVTATYATKELSEKETGGWAPGELLGRLKINVETGEAVNIPL